MSEQGSNDPSPTQSQSVLTPEGQIEQAGRFARGLRSSDGRRSKKLLVALILIMSVPTLLVLVIGWLGWLVDRF